MSNEKKNRVILELRVEHSEAYEKRLKAIKNKGINLKDDEEVENYLHNIENLNTRISDTLAVAYYHRKKGHQEKESHFLRLAKRRRKKQAEKKNQDVNENREFISLDEIIEHRQRLKHYKNYRQNMQYMLLCLYTYLPPIRSEYKNMPIVDNRDDDGESNCLTIKSDGRMNIHVRVDKVSKNRESINVRVPDKLQRILESSFENFPRTYLISSTTDRDAPMPYVSFHSLLKSIDHRLSVDTLRSAYATDYLSKIRSERQIKKISELMRTSPAMLRNEYLKFGYINREREEKKEEKKRDDSHDELDEKHVERKEKPRDEKEEDKDKPISRYDKKAYERYRDKNKSKWKKQNKKKYKKYMEDPTRKRIKRISETLYLYRKYRKQPTTNKMKELKLYKQDGVWKSRLQEELKRSLKE